MSTASRTWARTSATKSSRSCSPSGGTAGQLAVGAEQHGRGRAEAEGHPADGVGVEVRVAAQHREVALEHRRLADDDRLDADRREVLGPARHQRCDARARAAAGGEEDEQVRGTHRLLVQGEQRPLLVEEGHDGGGPTHVVAVLVDLGTRRGRPDGTSVTGERWVTSTATATARAVIASHATADPPASIEMTPWPTEAREHRQQGREDEGGVAPHRDPSDPVVPEGAEAAAVDRLGPAHGADDEGEVGDEEPQRQGGDDDERRPRREQQPRAEGDLDPRDETTDEVGVDGPRHLQCGERAVDRRGSRAWRHR